MFRFNLRAPYILLTLLLGAAFFLMLGPARQDSATYDEPQHLAAGYACAALRDCRLSPSHPPLVRAFAAVPLLSQSISFPPGMENWLATPLADWDFSKAFLYGGGNDADRMLLSARLMCMALTLLLILTTFLWGRELMGGWWGLVPAAFVALSPTFLAHGHYVTTDIGAALGFMAGTYFFLHFLNKASYSAAAAAGLALGLAQLLKFSTAILFPCFVILAAAHALFSCKNDVKRAALKLWALKKHFLLLAACSAALIYAVYAIVNSNYPPAQQRADTQIVLSSFSSKTFTPQLLAMADNRLTSPMAQYLFGLRLTMHRIAGGNTAYFCGVVSNKGSVFYFPLLFLLKEALPALLFTLCGLLATLKIVKGMRQNGVEFSAFCGATQSRFAFFSLALITGIYLIYSLASPLNIGFRHILPVIPFLYLLSAGAIKHVFDSIPADNRLFYALKRGAMPALTLWLFAEALTAYPYYLSRHNMFGGGTYGGYRYSTDSNFDWGQDLARLRKWLDNPPVMERVDKIAVDYSGTADLRHHLGEKAVPWSSADGDPRAKGINWLAVSANTLTQAKGNPGPGCKRTEREEYNWLARPFHPDYKAGTSIFIYKLADY